MKKTVIVLVSLLLTLNLFAQKVVASKIEAVKVYQQNATITRVLSTKLAAGQQEIVLTDISTTIDPASLQVQINGKATLLSAKYERNYTLPKKDNPKVTALKESLESTTDQIAWVRDQISILGGMEDILNKNKDLGGATAGFTPAQVIELTNSYKTKLFEIRKDLIKTKKEERNLNLAIGKLQKQLNELNAGFNKPSGNIILLLDAKTPQSIKLKCNYIVTNAGWTPLYDLRSEGISENVKLNYKANIYQNTGQDWEAVTMIVSTGNPSRNNNRPILNPLYAGMAYEIIDEVVVTAYGIKRENQKLDNNMYNMAVEEVAEDDEYESGFDYNTQINENQMSIEYNIQHKQTIASDGKQNLVALDSFELDTEYVYHAVPKLDKSAFLVAKIDNWSQYNLLTGEANLFFEGAYIGKSYINPNVTAKKLLLSFGRDESIVVERKAIKEYTSSKFLGTNRKEQFGYEISVKNKKSIPVSIELLDQIPVSTDKKITIELEEKGSAIYTEDIGKLLWKLDLQAGQTKKERFVYTVKYPKSKNVTGIK